MKYEKLVRDNVLDQMRAKGVLFKTRILIDDNEYIAELARKLVEEAGEFRSSISLEELADVQEIVFAIRDALDIDDSTMEQIRTLKRRIRGGFEGRVFLESAEDSETALAR